MHNPRSVGVGKKSLQNLAGIPNHCMPFNLSPMKPVSISWQNTNIDIGAIKWFKSWILLLIKSFSASSLEYSIHK